MDVKLLAGITRLPKQFFTEFQVRKGLSPFDQANSSTQCAVAQLFYCVLRLHGGHAHFTNKTDPTKSNSERKHNIQLRPLTN